MLVNAGNAPLIPAYRLGERVVHIVGSDGEDSYISYDGVDIVRAQGGKGGARGTSSDVTSGGDGGWAFDKDSGVEGVACEDSDDTARIGDYDSIRFGGTGGGCGGAASTNSDGGKAGWYPSGSFALKSDTQGVGCAGGGGGATMYGTGGNAGGASCTKAAGTVGGGGGAPNICSVGTPTRTGSSGGDGKIILRWVY